jgi:hypothetical protein
MRPTLDINRIENTLEWLQSAAQDYHGKQSITWYVDQIGRLMVEHAFANAQMAEAKRQWQFAKQVAYKEIFADPISQSKAFTPMLVKEYIGSKCDESQYNYEICERCSRTLARHLEMLQTCVSALKEEFRAHLTSKSHTT